MSTAAALADLPRLFVYEYLSAGGAVAAGEAGLLAEGRAMRAAIVADLHGTAVTVAGLPGEPGCVAAAPGESPAAFVARQAALHDAVWVTAPETGGLLHTLCTAVPPARWIGCDAAAIALASSKRRTRAGLAAASVPVPHAGLDAAGRWVEKPDDGAGAVATRVLSGPPAALPPGQHAEPWVEGEAMSLSVQVTAARGAELLSVNRLQVQLDADGTVLCDWPQPAVWRADDARWPLLQRLAAQVAAAMPGLRGFVGIDFVWHPTAGPVVIEVNPRATSALVGLSAALGRPVAREIVQGWADDTR